VGLACSEINGARYMYDQLFRIDDDDDDITDYAVHDIVSTITDDSVGVQHTCDSGCTLNHTIDKLKLVVLANEVPNSNGLASDDVVNPHHGCT